MNNAFPLVLLIGGALGAVYFSFGCIEAAISFAPMSAPVVEFAVCSLLAVIGWRELTATDEIY